ncbi:MAG: hypothetical protein Q9163_000103 [Psora crenata]
MPSLSGTRRRHAKHPSSTKKFDPPPALALASSRPPSNSTATAQSTPRSIFSAGLKAPRRPPNDVKPVRREECIPPKGLDGLNNERVDVFAFLEKEDDAWDSPTREQKAEAQDLSDQEELPSVVTARRAEPTQISPRYSDLEVRAIQDGVQRAWGRASLHSDSGISMHSGSPDPDSPILQHKYPMIQEHIPDALEATVKDEEDKMTRLSNPPGLTADQRDVSPKHWPPPEDRHKTVSEVCQLSPKGTSSIDPDFDPSYTPEVHTRSTSDLAYHKSRHSKAALSRKTGYDLLASNINSRDDTVLKPIYRKFETLNNRMLLYLQDEISEIEEQLRELDAAIAHEDANLQRGPESRRAEAKLPSQLQWHRLDLLGRSFAKVDQYNADYAQDRALTSYGNLIKSLDPASGRDIAAYKKWIAEHTPVSGKETKFLQQEADLLTVTSHHSSPQPDLHRGIELDSPFILPAFAFVSTIIVFQVVPQLLARLVISAMVGIAYFCSISPTMPMGTEEFGRWKKGITHGALLNNPISQAALSLPPYEIPSPLASHTCGVPYQKDMALKFALHHSAAGKSSSYQMLRTVLSSPAHTGLYQTVSKATVAPYLLSRARPYLSEKNNAEASTSPQQTRRAHQSLTPGVHRPTARTSILRARFRQRCYHRHYSSGPSPRTANVFTKSIMGLCVLTWAASAYANYQERQYHDTTLSVFLQENFVTSLQNWREGRWWTILTSSIMHANPLHLAINLYALNSVGPFAMTIFGLPGFFALWALSELTCGSATVYWEYLNMQSVWRRWNAAAETESRKTFLGITPTEDTRRILEASKGSVGLSGALFGFATALSFAAPRLGTQLFFIPLTFPVWLVNGLFAGFSWWALSTGAAAGLGHAGHLGGMVGGASFFILRYLAGRGRGV